MWWNPLTWFEALPLRPRRKVAAEQLMATQADRRPTEPHVERPGPAEFRDPLVRREIAKAAVWFGMALLIVGVIVLAQPLLLIVGGAIFAVFLDGGTRLLGRVLPIPRGWRLLLVILLGFGFLGWVFWFAGTTIAAQFEALRDGRHRAVQPADGLRRLARADAARASRRTSAPQLLGSVGRLTSAVGSAIGAVTSVIAMIVIGIFLAAEPRIYDRGIAWMLPLRHRAGFYRIAEHVGFTLRRLLFGRLVGMIFEGVFTWVMLSLGGVPMAALLGLVTGVLAFIPNIGAITSGVLMVAVGFSAGPHQGVYAIFVYFFVQNIDGYLVVPYIARRTVDLRAGAGARDAAADGRAVRDPRRAVRRPDPGDAEGGAGRPQQAAGGRRGRRRREVVAGVGLCCGCWLAAPASAASSPRRRGTTFRTWTSKVRSLSVGKPCGGGPVAEGEPLRHGEAVVAAFLHLASWLRRSPGRPGHRERLRAACASLLSNTVPSSSVPDIFDQRGVGSGRSARPCRP